MRKIITIAAIALLSAHAVGAQETKVYRWVDAEGTIHYGDSIPAEYAEYPKQVLNDRGVTVDNLAGKKTEEEREAERRECDPLAVVFGGDSIKPVGQHHITPEARLSDARSLGTGGESIGQAVDVVLIGCDR